VIGQEPIDLDTGFTKMNATLENFTQLGSGWVVVSVYYFWLDIARYQPLQGGSYVELPQGLKQKKAIINVKNKDDNCLRWALRSALFPVAKNSDRPSQYPKVDGLDFKGVTSPTPITEIGKVETQNNLSISTYLAGRLPIMTDTHPAM
jgi:hypothetical protein